VTPTTIQDGTVAEIHYTLTLEDGSIADSSDGRAPLMYLHGHGNIVPGLERQLTGHKTGEEVEVVVEPAEGYGDYDPDAEESVPRDAFPAEAELEPGMMFHTEDEHGNVQPLWVKDVAEDAVLVTSNHPLAGRTLYFKVKVGKLRAASAEEIAHGHPHGPGGHHHH
jgi:FKBP-type peptidyl-prolyl cis-trans isomerase SlyD